MFEGANPNNVLPGGQSIYIHKIDPGTTLTITVPAEFSCETPTVLGEATFVAKSQNEFEFTNSSEKVAYARICINIPEDADVTKTYLVLDGQDDVSGLGSTSDEIRVVKTSEIEPDVIDVGGTAQLTFTFGAFTSKDLSALSKYFDIVGEPVLDASEGNYDIDDFVVVVHDEDLSLGRVTWNMKLKDNIVPGSYCARGSQGRTDGVDAMSVIDCPFTVVAPAQEPIPQDDPQEPSEGNSEPEKHTHDQVMAQYNLWYSEHELRLYKEDYKEVSWKAFEDVQDRFLSTVEDENHKCSEVAALFSSVKKAFDGLEI